MNRLRIALHVSFAAFVLLLLVISSRPALAHGGGIDGYGGHNDKQERQLSLAPRDMRRADIRIEIGSH